MSAPSRRLRPWWSRRCRKACTRFLHSRRSSASRHLPSSRCSASQNLQTPFERRYNAIQQARSRHCFCRLPSVSAQVRQSPRSGQCRSPSPSRSACIPWCRTSAPSQPRLSPGNGSCRSAPFSARSPSVSLCRPSTRSCLQGSLSGHTPRSRTTPAHTGLCRWSG